MKFRLDVECDNAAFGDTDEERNAELSRILHKLAERIGQMAIVVSGKVHDVNGNKVGDWSVEQ